MTKKPTNTAPKEQFIKMPRGLMASDAWLSMRGGHLKIISFLCEEHMRRGGKQNGNLKAPQRQLYKLGIWTRAVAGLIDDLEKRGLIACQRGGMRSPILYTLTWLPTADGKPASHAWRAYRAPETEKSARETTDSPARETTDRSANLHAKPQTDSPISLHAKPQTLSRKGSYQEGADYSVSEHGDAVAAAGVPGRVDRAGNR